ncbi:hypothetical protein P692DRAFT_201784049 [Suillus brevipes Sb2]|nr:hypothetical protein P692DRAFT_201784049 [Suillus brevipes Sb2]
MTVDPGHSLATRTPHTGSERGPFKVGLAGGIGPHQQTTQKAQNLCSNHKFQVPKVIHLL